MKQVLLTDPNPAPFTLAVNASSERYYGVQQDTFKGFIARPGFLVGEYHPFCIDAITKGNGWTGFDSSDLGETIRKILSHIRQKYTVYEFNTAAELFQWLGK